MPLKTVTFLVTGVLALGAKSIRGQDNGALLDLLIKKKLITEKKFQLFQADLNLKF